ncbi:hypothetical protein ACFLYO_02410 [Chloroflexota bacterium]
MVRSRVVLGLLGLVLAVLVMVAGVGSPVVIADDGRLNCHAASPIAIYCTNDGILILNGSGQELLRLSTAAIEAAGIPAEDADPVVLGLPNDSNLQVFRLSTGQYLVKYTNVERGEIFEVIWSGCGDTTNEVYLNVYDAVTGKQLSNAMGCGKDGSDSPASVTAASSGVTDQHDCEGGHGGQGGQGGPGGSGGSSGGCEDDGCDH